MDRGVRGKPALRLRELALAAGPVVPARVMPRDGDVNETLQEVALLLGGVAPLVLELLVRLEVRPGAHQLESTVERHGAIIGVPATSGLVEW